MAITEITNEEFVRAYIECATQTEVAVRLGVTQGAISRRAKRLRQLGVRLPFSKRGVPHEPVNVEALNELISRTSK